MAKGVKDSMSDAPNLLQRRFSAVAGRVEGMTGHPLTFMFSCIIVGVWVIASLAFHLSGTWQALISTAISMGTFLMVFLIQNSQSRNSAAVQAKLDELIRALEPANNKYIGLEHRTITHVHELRQESDDGIGL